MCRCCLVSGALMLVLVLAVAAAAEPPKKSKAWYSWLMPFKKAESPAPAADRARGKPGEPGATTSVESPAAHLAREKADWLRRIAVCDKLHDIALDTNDEELRRRADELDMRAWDMYLKRAGQAPIAGRAMPINESALERRMPVNSQAEQSRVRSGVRARGVGQESTREE